MKERRSISRKKSPLISGCKLIFRKYKHALFVIKFIIDNKVYLEASFKDFRLAGRSIEITNKPKYKYGRMCRGAYSIFYDFLFRCWLWAHLCDQYRSVVRRKMRTRDKLHFSIIFNAI